MKKMLSVMSLLAFNIVFTSVTYAGSVTGKLRVSATVAAACTATTSAKAHSIATEDISVDCPSGLPYKTSFDDSKNHGAEKSRFVASRSEPGVAQPHTVTVTINY